MEKTTAGADIVLVDTLPALTQAAQDIANNNPGYFGFDVETWQRWTLAEEAEGKAAIDYNRIGLRSMQFGRTDVVYVIDCARLPNWKDCTEYVQLLTNDAIWKVAHNKSFEYKVMLKAAGIEIRALACTMHAESLLFLGILPKKPSLAELVEKYCGLVMEKDVRDSFVTERECLPLRDEQILYAANDVDVLMTIFAEQRKQLDDAKLWEVLLFEWKTRRCFDRIELRGIRVDTQRWQELYETALSEHAAIQAQLYSTFRADAVVRWENKLLAREAERTLILDELASGTLSDADRAVLETRLKELPTWYKVRPNKQTGKLEPKKTAMWNFDKVLTSAMQMKEVFALNGIEVTDTNERTLLRQKYFQWQGKETWANYPARGIAMIDQLLKFRELDKRLSTYGPTWLRHTSPVTGKVHAEYDILKETARTGCQRPNVQNVPKRGSGTVYRTAFVPDEGNVFVVSDYSQIELRVAADFSGDPAMIAAFNSGADFHTATAALMFKIPVQELADRIAAKDKKAVDMRRAAKSVNFGIIFGIGRKKLSEQITFDSGVVCTEDEAAKFLQSYKESFPTLMKYLKDKEQYGQERFVTFTCLGHRRMFTPPVRPYRPVNANKDSEAWRAFVEADEKYKRRMGGIGRESKNTPIQGSAAVIAKLAIHELEDILPKYRAGIVGFIHDEIIVECPKEEAEEVLGIVKRTMEKSGRVFLKKVKTEVDAHIGYDWLCSEHVEESMDEFYASLEGEG